MTTVRFLFFTGMICRRSKLRATFLAGIFISCPASAVAGPPVHPATQLEVRLQELWTQDTLTGDWLGVRKRLASRGLEFTAVYGGEVFGIVRGGFRQGAVYNGLLELGFDLDLQKLLGWHGAKLHLNGFYPHGASGTDKYARDLGTFSNIDFFDSYRFFEAWFEQSFFAERASVRLGLLAMDEEFAAGATDYSPLFINSAFGVATAISGNFPVPIYAIAALGARLRVEPAEGFFMQAAIYDGNPAPAVLGDFSADAADTNEFNHFSTHFALRRDEGAVMFGEIGYAFNQPIEAPETELIPQGQPDPESSADGTVCALNGKTVRPVRGLGGSYRAGYAYHTDTFTDVADSYLSALGSSRAPENIRDSEGNWAVYFSADQELWREAGSDTDSVGLFARTTFAPASKNFFSKSIEVGLVYRGLAQSDGRDSFGIGFGYFDVSKQVEAANHAANRADRTEFEEPDYEAVLEITYRYQVTPWWTIQPDFQWIIHPGGSDALNDALVIGLRTVVTF